MRFFSYINRSIIFTNGTEEFRLAVASKEREQTKSKSSSVTTQILPLGKFYSAEPEHQVLLNILFLFSQNSLRGDVVSDLCIVKLSSFVNLLKGVSYISL